MNPGHNEVSIFIEANFDYAHFLPGNEKCFPLHGHTSVVELELTGEVNESGMVMDYSEARKLLREAISEIDHKLVAPKSYSRLEGKNLIVEYRNFFLKLPVEYVFLIKGEGTSENIAEKLAQRVTKNVPKNVSRIRLTVTEGIGKGVSVIIIPHPSA